MLNFILYIFIFQIFVLIQISISQEPNSDKEFSVEKSFLENEDDIPDDLVEKILLDELYVNLENPSVSSNITPESLEDLSTHMESINSGPENTLRVSEDNSNIRNNISTSNSNTTTSQNRNFDLQNTSNDSKNIEMFLGNANMCVRSINFYIKSSIDILKHTYQCLYNESPVLRSECLNLQPNDNTLQDKMSALQNSISELQNTTSELQCIMKNLHKSTSESQSRICKLQNTSYLKCTNSESTNSSFNLINTNLDLRHTAPNLENNALGLNYASSSLQNNASNSQREFHSIHNNSILQQNTLSSVNNTHNLGNTTSNSQYISSLMRNDTSRMENIFPNSSSTSNLQNTTLNLQYPIYESLNSVINAQDTSCYLQNLTSNIQQTFQSDYSSNFQTHFGIGNTWFNMQNHTSNLQNEPFNLQYDTCNLQHNAYNSQNTTGIRCASHKLEDIVSMLQHILSNLQRITPYTQNISAQTINNTHNLQETNPIVQDNISNLEEITPNVDDCNDNLEEIAPNVDDSDDNLEEITANVDDSDDNLEDTSQTSRNNNSNSQKNVTTRVRRRTSRLNRTSLRLRRNTSNSQNTVPRLRSNSSNLQNESCNLQNESSNLQNESSNLQNESSNLQNESSNLQNESSNLQNKSSNLQNESSNLQNESSNLQSESSNLQSESSNLQSESSNLQSESSDLQYSMSYLQDVCAKLFSITHNLKCMDIEIYDVHTFLDNKIVNYLNKKFAVDNETDGNSNLDDDDNSIKPYRKRPCKSKDTEKSNMDKSKSSSFSSFKDIHMERLPIRNFTLFCSKEVFKMDYRTIIPIANSLNNIHLTLEENKTKLIKDYNLKIEELKNFIIKISKNVDRSILNKLKFRNDILSLSPDKILEEVLQKIKYNRNLVKCSVPDEFYIRMKIKMFLPKLNSVSASIRSFKTLETKVKQLIKTNVFSMLTHGILLLLPNDKSKTFIKLFNNLDNLLDTSEKSFMEGKYFLNEQLIKKHRILIFSANKSLGRLYRLLKSLLMNLEFFNLSYNDNGKIFTTIFHFLYNTNKKNEDEFNHTTNELYEKHLKNDILSILSYEKKYILECHARANNHFNMNDDEINESSKWLQSLLDDEKNARNAMEIYSKIIKAAKYEHIFFLMRILSKLQISLKLLYNSTNMKSLRSSYAAISKKRLDRIITEIHYQKKMLQYIKLNAKFFSILSGIIHNSNIFFGDTDSDITLLQDNLLFIKKVAKSITDHIDKNRNEKDNYTNEGLLILLLYSIEMLNKCVLYM
ncbi:surface-associated interspersed protein (SURFIN) [Plasmodium gallinaceum]|uniref:Surface-associated interspersed protein (SURFIN) n=1 Tax=Plasmodium gallinaceum TaxID=5849 RepID=A0A1J1GMD9_PLAGA|nr:surface-associated interspersed protein (SURFIN) [Plasmodium gallinaceum]CRG93524.1 surface-associated interspersed protein (SURFIN) [Plasmodium gallinaceum]